jgi:hypothetical protein
VHVSSIHSTTPCHLPHLPHSGNIVCTTLTREHTYSHMVVSPQLACGTCCACARLVVQQTGQRFASTSASASASQKHLTYSTHQLIHSNPHSRNSSQRRLFQMRRSPDQRKRLLYRVSVPRPITRTFSYTAPSSMRMSSLQGISPNSPLSILYGGDL